MESNREQQLLSLVDEIVAKGPYSPTWESLMTAPAPAWFRDRRLGIFIHWGPFSVPRYHDWYARNMYIKDSPEYEHHLKNWGDHKTFGYKDFIPLLTGERFDPAQWLDLFEHASAGYICPVAEHHDGFQMYESDLSRWNAAQMGPCRDVLGELKEETERRGMVFCTSSHRAEHWFFMGHGRQFDSDIGDDLQKDDLYWPAMPEAELFDPDSKPWPTEEYLQDWLARTAELILKYHPKFLYFDWWIQHRAFRPWLKKLAAFYYNCGKLWGEDVQICYKHDAMAFGTGIVEVERGSLGDAKPYPWQTDTAVGRNSWCDSAFLEYKSSEEIICTLIDVVSKGGNLLLNIGPRADGSIPEGDRRILEDLGAWMQVHSQAIHGSRCWRHFAEGPTRAAEGKFHEEEIAYTSQDYRFTVANGAIYAICMKCPEDGRFTVRSFAAGADENLTQFQGTIESVEVLGYGPAAWRQDEAGLHVHAPGLSSPFPVTVKITAE